LKRRPEDKTGDKRKCFMAESLRKWCWHVSASGGANQRAVASAVIGLLAGPAEAAR